MYSTKIMQCARPSGFKEGDVKRRCVDDGQGGGDAGPAVSRTDACTAARMLCHNGYGVVRIGHKGHQSTPFRHYW